MPQVLVAPWHSGQKEQTLQLEGQLDVFVILP